MSGYPGWNDAGILCGAGAVCLVRTGLDPCGMHSGDGQRSERA